MHNVERPQDEVKLVGIQELRHSGRRLVRLSDLDPSPDRYLPCERTLAAPDLRQVRPWLQVAVALVKGRELSVITDRDLAKTARDGDLTYGLDLCLAVAREGRMNVVVDQKWMGSPKTP